MSRQRIIVGILLLILPACAGRRVIGSGKAIVKFTRGDLRELREAFRTTAEKTVSLPTLGEIACIEHRCTASIQGLAPVYGHEALVDHVNIPGVLAFTPGVADYLLAKSEDAGERDKDFTMTVEDGQVSCNGKGCVFELTFTKGSTTRIEAKAKRLVWHAE